ncbi:uncharacterized protein LOC112591454 [Melanaphis sacchari]|uniref:uncharacterized protein LOC112591454 n=1 Tax=Melanaphis sacchari TaxID=742174 RepID=UPI000DC1590E|nr:uncharacterized protein LOC112591454 [Melanaphis sacchari]XP_025191063.1 uncharacterized protein LOC112591454 [Melanaphis sacchari]XP_025191064.1 uncharacterized protein LOC112591454 [Melanaphis sacchari]
MLATAKRATIVALLLVCCYYDQAATARHDHVRTKSGSTNVHRTKHLTSGMPPVTVVSSSVNMTNGGSSDVDADAIASEENPNGGKLSDFLFGRPNKIFKNLMRSGVRVVQRGMDVFQGVSNKVYRVARKKISGSSTGSSSLSSSKSDENGGNVGGRQPVKRHVKAAPKKPTGFVRSVARMLDTGITGVERVTDLGLLLGNLGTHKIMAQLDGKSGNQEIFNLIIKYVGSRVGKQSKGSAGQFINDVGTISTFAATDDEVTNSISLIMEKLMSNPKVSKAMVRLAITVLDSSPSTSCLLDQLPLSSQDVRMVFDIFVGSNGQMMLKTIAGLVSDLTTGPDTKAFLESALGMMSMFKSDDPEADIKNADKPATSVVGSLTDFFTGGDDEEEDDIDDYNKSVPPPTNNNRKKGSSVSETVPKPSKKKLKKDDDPWFSNTETSFDSSMKKLDFDDDPWFSSSGTTSNRPTKKTDTPKSNNAFENSSTDSSNKKVDKKNHSKTKVVIENIDNASFRDDNKHKNSKPIKVKKNRKTFVKKPSLRDDFDSEEKD